MTFCNTVTAVFHVKDIIANKVVRFSNLNDDCCIEVLYVAGNTTNEFEHKIIIDKNNQTTLIDTTKFQLSAIANQILVMRFKDTVDYAEMTVYVRITSNKNFVPEFYNAD